MTARGEVRGKMDLEHLREEVGAGRIHTVITALPDLYGRLVGKRITGAFFLDEIAHGGMHVCDYLLACDMEMDPTPGYSFTSWETGYGDLHAVPDLQTLRRAAWLDGTAIVLCDAKYEDRDDPIEVSPRRVLRRQLERARALGLAPHTGSELEFFLFDETYSSARSRGYHELRTHQDYVEDYHVLSSTFAEPVVGAIRHAVDASAIPVEFSKGEWGPGQHEINLRYADALEMADRHVIYKQAAKEIAAEQGKSLTFMAKWDARHAGNSLHVHLSMAKSDGSAAFAGEEPLPGTALTSSASFRHALAGMIEHARELAMLFAPNPNSYKRYQDGTFAPTRVAWSYDNRTVGFRVVGHGESLRMECRIPGGDANPYLVYAGLIAAALDGIDRELEPGPAFEGDAYAAADIPRIPQNLDEAIELFGSSEFIRGAFGDDVVEHLLHFARTEAAAAARHVTDFERGRFFERG
ncbi:MAG: glutamine synthetase family protein [Myxococcota bacterium]|nr:glutamine synthetase family protein [Myxococcota bacterium]